jgi:hypothetical protein
MLYINIGILTSAADDGKAEKYVNNNVTSEANTIFLLILTLLFYLLSVEDPVINLEEYATTYKIRYNCIG